MSAVSLSADSLLNVINDIFGLLQAGYDSGKDDVPRAGSISVPRPLSLHRRGRRHLNCQFTWETGMPEAVMEDPRDVKLWI